jgi:hypothetical protein
MPKVALETLVRQVWPSATQAPARQQLFPAHFAPVQQGWPGPPQTAHTLPD